MKNKRSLTILVSFVFVFITGCATYEPVNSSVITPALDLEKADRFAITVVKTTASDTAFSKIMQDEASAELIDELEDQGLDYVGERDPQIRFVLRTHPAVEASYMDASVPEKVVVTTTKETRNLDGTVTTTSQTRSVGSPNASELIYLRPNSRLFLLDAYDATTNALLWRGYVNEDDTGLNAERISDAIEKLTDRLREET